MIPARDGVVYVVVDEDIVGVSTRSESGTCFYLTAVAFEDAIGYAEDEDCGSADEQEYVSAWE